MVRVKKQLVNSIKRLGFIGFVINGFADIKMTLDFLLNVLKLII